MAKPDSDKELENFLNTFDIESHWQQLEGISSNAASVSGSGLQTNEGPHEGPNEQQVDGTSKNLHSVEKSLLQSADVPAEKPVVVATDAADSIPERTTTRPTLSAVRTKTADRSQLGGDSKLTGQQPSRADARVTKTHFQTAKTTPQTIKREVSPATETPISRMTNLSSKSGKPDYLAVHSPPPKSPPTPPPQQGEAKPKPRKRNFNSSNIAPAPAGRDDSTTSRTSDQPLTGGVDAYHQRNIKFYCKFQVKSALTLADSQLFSRMLVLRWENSVAIAEAEAAATAAAAPSQNDGKKVKGIRALFEDCGFLSGKVDASELATFKTLLPVVKREQKYFQEYAKKAHSRLPKFTTDILPDEDEAYFLDLQRSLSQRRSQYPAYYRTLDSVSIVTRSSEGTQCDTANAAEKLSIEFKEIVACRGKSQHLNPHIITMSSKPSLGMNVAHLAKQFPTEDSAIQSWKPGPISEDNLAKSLARTHACSLVLTCGTLKRLLLDFTCESGWEMPVLLDQLPDSRDDSGSASGSSRWIVSIDSSLAHTKANGCSVAEMQRKLAQLRGLAKFTKKAGQGKAKTREGKPQEPEQQPPAKRQKTDDGLGEVDQLALLETFGASYNESGSDEDENANEASNAAAIPDATGKSLAAASSDKKEDVVNRSAAGPALVYSIVQIGRHRLLVRSRRPPQLPQQIARRLFDCAGRGFAPQPGAASQCARFQSRYTPCRLRVRLERQPYFGCEVASPIEASRDWLASLATGGGGGCGTALLRARCNVFDGRVLLYELLSGEDLAREAAPADLNLASFSDLADALERLRQQAASNAPTDGIRLLVCRAPSDPTCRLMLADAACREHSLAAPPMPPAPAALAPPEWQPIDPSLMSHPHWRDKRVPALFDPRIVTEEDKERVRRGFRQASSTTDQAEAEPADQVQQQQQQQHPGSNNIPFNYEDTQQPRRGGRGRGGGRGGWRGRGRGGRGGIDGGGGGDDGAPPAASSAGSGPRVKDPQSRRSQKGLRWLQRTKKRHRAEAGGHKRQQQQQVSTPSATGSIASAAMASAARWVPASSNDQGE